MIADRNIGVSSAEARLGVIISINNQILRQTKTITYTRKKFLKKQSGSVYKSTVRDMAKVAIDH